MDSGKYVYANFITFAVAEDPSSSQGDVDSNQNADRDILLIITSPPYSGTTHLHWSSRSENMSTIKSWPDFLAQCDSELKERCGVNLPPLDGVSPSEFKGIFQETMTKSGYNMFSSDSSVGSSNQVGEYRFDFDAYKRR